MWQIVAASTAMDSRLFSAQNKVLMINDINIDHEQSVRQNLRWLFLLRNFLIAGETFILVFAVHILRYDVLESQLWAIISIAMIVNSLTWYRLQQNFPVTELELFVHLIFDVFGITVALYYTGGANNPFSWFFILPLVITATVLPNAYTWCMLALTSICHTMLIGYHIPLSASGQAPNLGDIPAVIIAIQSNQFADIHVLAIWFGFLLIAGIVAYFIVEMRHTLSERDQRLSEIREQGLRDERVVALGALAAGAAHEIGTPLGTMAILAHDLEQEYRSEDFADLHVKIKILKEQIARCKKALSVMSTSAGEIRAESGSLMLLNEYLEDVVLQWQDQRPDVRLEFDIEESDPMPQIVAEMTLTHALTNILNNAAAVSPNWVGLFSRWDEKEIVIEIIDNGPGIDQEIIKHIGKTPIGSRRKGLGVGLFLASSTIERLGGSLKLYNRTKIGACAKIILPIILQNKRYESGQVAITY